MCPYLALSHVTNSVWYSPIVDIMIAIFGYVTSKTVAKGPPIRVSLKDEYCMHVEGNMTSAAPGVQIIYGMASLHILSTR